MFKSTFEVTIKDEGENYSIVSFFGNMDSFGLSQRRQDFMKIVDEFSKEYLVFDFSELNFLNSESIGLLTHINEKLMAENKKLVIVAAKKSVLDVLKMIGLLETLQYYRKMEDFLNKIKNGN